MTITIRSLEPSDRESWQALWYAYLSFYESRVSEDVTATTWQRLLTEGEDPSGHCAVDAHGSLVGIVHFLFHRSCWTLGDYCYLQDLYVACEARENGTGEKLIRSVQAAATARGASQIYWLTQHFNANARRLYDRVGELTPFIKYKAI